MSVVEEGFICPYCLVGFATSGKLQSHFVEMHSGNEAGVCCEGDEDLVGTPVGYGQLGDDEVSFVPLLCTCIVTSGCMKARFFGAGSHVYELQ